MKLHPSYIIILMVIITLSCKEKTSVTTPQLQENYKVDVEGLVPYSANQTREQVIDNIHLLDSDFTGSPLKIESLKFYCGSPDAISQTDTDGIQLWAYFYDQDDSKWVAYAFVKGEVVQELGYNDASVNDHSGFKVLKPENMPPKIDSGEQATPSNGDKPSN